MLLSNKRRKIFGVELLFIVSITISFVFELIFSGFQLLRLLNLIENILLTLVLIISVGLVNNKTIRRIFFKWGIFFFNIILFIETSYYVIFNVNISPSAIYVFFETNNKEIKEFLSFYLDANLMLYGLALLMINVFVYFIKSFIPVSINKCFSGYTKIVVSIIFILLILKFTSLRHYNLPYLILKSYYVVYFESKVLETGPYKSENGIFKDTKIINNDIARLHVIVIGESTTRNNMSLYGYSRDTNPLLKRNHELSIFKNVISPHAGTTASLTKALSLLNYEDSNIELKGSIMQLFNSADYATFWISNQQPVGFAETDITKIIDACKNKMYVNTESSEDTRLLDETVFEKIDEVLNNVNMNTVIFIHLQGTHLNYYNRYPETYNFFNDMPPEPKYSSNKIHKIINTYDNAILYNDFIVSSIIDKVKAKNTSSTVLYFSDHGEEVYNTIKFAGHNDDIGTLPMFDIPFLLWQSKEYKLNNSIEVDLDRPYMTDDLFHSIAHLCGINNEHVNLEKSIFSKSFKKRKRIILNNKDYDSILAIKRNDN